MIQAEIGGAARVDPGTGVQRPGFMIRDFTLKSWRDEEIRLSDFRGRSNLVVVFTAYSRALRALLEEIARRAREFSELDTAVLAVVPYGREEREHRQQDSVEGTQERAYPIPEGSTIVVLYDKTHAAYMFSGAADESGRPLPLVYVTDRFGEIVTAYTSPSDSTSPGVHEILSTLEFLNQQCPECEPPEWPRS